MKYILLLTNSINHRVDYVINIAKGKYSVLVVDDFDSFKEQLNLSSENIAAVVIDNPSKRENIGEVFKLIHEKNSYLNAYPTLLLTETALGEDDEQYIDDAASVIYYGEPPKIILKRIDNCISYMNSASFQEFSEMLKVLPSLIYLKDAHARYVFCSQFWKHLDKDGTGEFSVIGKTDLDIRKNKTNAMKAYSADLEIIRKGVGLSYIVKEVEDGEVEYLQIIKEPIKKPNGKVSGIIAIVNNVTEQELLKQELRKKSITDGLTGLYNRVYLEEYTTKVLNKDVFPLSIISADCDDLKVINDKYGHLSGDKYICLASSLLQDNLPKESVIFRTGGDEFLVILPKTSKEKGEQLVDELIEKSKNYKTDDFDLQISIGVHTTEDAVNSIDRCIALSDESMYQAKKNKKSNR